MKRIKTFIVLASVLGIAGVALVAGSPSASAAQVNNNGLAFRAVWAHHAACLSINDWSFAAIKNNCEYPVVVVTSMPIAYAGWHDTRVTVYGNNSWCQSITTNGVGNGADVGPWVWTTAGPDTWQTLQTGWRYTWNETPLTIMCGLDPGEVIGAASATW